VTGVRIPCPYCGADAKLVDGVHVYPHRPDLAPKLFWICDPCEAYVGTHVKTGMPLGTLANAELRAVRNRAHKAFDPLWRNNRHCSRTDAYLWLARAMNLPAEQAHIAMFDVEQCATVVALVEQLHAEMKAAG